MEEEYFSREGLTLVLIRRSQAELICPSGRCPPNFIRRMALAGRYVARGLRFLLEAELKSAASWSGSHWVQDFQYECWLLTTAALMHPADCEGDRAVFEGG